MKHLGDHTSLKETKIYREQEERTCWVDMRKVYEEKM